MRTLLVWLLMLAVPTQGAAAATMALCKGHGTAATALLQAGAAGHLHDHSPHANAPAAQGHPASDADATALVASSPHDLGDGAPSDTHKCSACASCCSLGVLPSTLKPPPVDEPAARVFIDVVPDVEPFAADGPERPPRIDLA
jgi:hypothetical protein